MSKPALNKNGFSIIEVVIAIIIIAVLASLGFVLYKHTQTATPSASPSQSSASLSLKEWGVRITLDTPVISDAYYIAPSTDPTTGRERIGLGTKATDGELECSDGSRIQQAVIDYIYRSTDENTVVTGASSEAVKVGNYYYSIESASGAGCVPSSASAPRASDVSKKFIQNFEAKNLTSE